MGRGRWTRGRGGPGSQMVVDQPLSRTSGVTKAHNGRNKEGDYHMAGGVVYEVANRGGGKRGGRNEWFPQQDNNTRDSGKGNDRPPLEEISVKVLKEGWAADNTDGAIKQLRDFLEYKCRDKRVPKEKAKEQPKVVKKYRLEGDALIVSVRAEDTLGILRCDNYDFKHADATLKLSVSLNAKATPSETSKVYSNKEPPKDRAQKASSKVPPKPDTLEFGTLAENHIFEWKEILTDWLAPRYHRGYASREAGSPGFGHLDLSKLRSDNRLVNELHVDVFGTPVGGFKFFPFLMYILGKLLGDVVDEEERKAMVTSVSLADNALDSVSHVSTLAQTFPGLVFLDLSKNQLRNLKALEDWRMAFPKLDDLRLIDNPIETETPYYRYELLRWFPSLTKINGQRERTLEEAKEAMLGKLPLKSLEGHFDDEEGIGDYFVNAFFSDYDHERKDLVDRFYDEESRFSLSINDLGLRTHDPESAGGEVPLWDPAYLERNRNLLRLTQLYTKNQRLFAGKSDIRKAFEALPGTLHPIKGSDRRKWCIECHTTHGLPDRMGSLAKGAAGMMVMVHGEFKERDPTTVPVSEVTRSFDRTFVLGIRATKADRGIWVLSDMLVLRPYGGYKEWLTDDERKKEAEAPAAGADEPEVPLPHPMYGQPALKKAADQVKAEVLAVRLSRQMGTTIEASQEILIKFEYDVERAADWIRCDRPNLPTGWFFRQNEIVDKRA